VWSNNLGKEPLHRSATHASHLPFHARFSVTNQHAHTLLGNVMD
jgi:hypothetical protein